MTSPVDGPAAASAIAALIGQALGGRLTKAAHERRRKEPAKSSASAASAGAARARPSLSDLIIARAEELNPNAPDFHSRALRVVVEASLLQAFGQQLINAPRFQGMVDAVWRDMEAAPQLQQDIRVAMDTLIKAPRGKPPTP